jgi:membrane-associated phospholipid phosphatase
VLKDHWGRARPSQVTEFGGTKTFTPAPLPADQCERNCSFPAGHPAMGFYLLSMAFLVRDQRRRRWAEAAAIGAGAAIGVVRLAQGGHFLSDVVFAGLLVAAVSWVLHRLVVPSPPRQGEGLILPTERLRQLAPPALGLLALVLLSMAFIDRPVAIFFHDRFPTVHAVFGFISQFGLGKGYLIVSAAVFAALRLAGRLVRKPARARRLALDASRALYVFLAVALSGIAVDLIKVVFGRARPKLLFVDGFYGFAWGATRSDYWSFPSGHATTIAALATAFFLLWPRFWPAYLAAALLVSASRVIIDAHYLSDVIAGAALGTLTAWAIWHGFARGGIALENRNAAQRDPEPVA